MLIKSNPVGMLTAVGEKATRIFSRLRVTPEVSEFASVNKSFWQSYRSRTDDGIIMIDATLMCPAYIFLHSTLGQLYRRGTVSLGNIGRFVSRLVIPILCIILIGNDS